MDWNASFPCESVPWAGRFQCSTPEFDQNPQETFRTLYLLQFKTFNSPPTKPTSRQRLTLCSVHNSRSHCRLARGVTGPEASRSCTAAHRNRPSCMLCIVSPLWYLHLSLPPLLLPCPIPPECRALCRRPVECGCGPRLGDQRGRWAYLIPYQHASRQVFYYDTHFYFLNDRCFVVGNCTPFHPFTVCLGPCLATVRHTPVWSGAARSGVRRLARRWRLSRSSHGPRTTWALTGHPPPLTGHSRGHSPRSLTRVSVAPFDYGHGHSTTTPLHHRPPRHHRAARRPPSRSHGGPSGIARYKTVVTDISEAISV